jgi:hypothetical protein
MELITVNFLSIGSFCMLIFYMSNGLCEIKFASATAIQSGIGGGASSMSITSNGECADIFYSFISIINSALFRE